MTIDTRWKPIAGGQKVAGNLREAESKKPFAVSWDKTSATVGQVVGIRGTANFIIKNPLQVTVTVLFNNGFFALAENLSVRNGQITAQWKVKAAKAGLFKEGVYDVEIKYGTLSSKTTAPLKIVDVVQSGDFFG